MAVAETTSIDQGALQDDGRLLLAMTETRPYQGGQSSGEILAEDFRRKLNTYVYAIRSGQLADSGPDGRAPAGFDIVLFCADEPVPAVQEMIEVAGHSLAAEGDTVRWRILDQLRETVAAETATPAEATVDQLLLRLAKALAQELPAGWTHAQYRPAMIIGRSEDALMVRLSDGAQHPVEPPPEAPELIPWLRHKMYEPGTGTWLSASFLVVSDGSFSPEFEFSQEPSWGRPVADEAWVEELATYPRDAAHLPDWWSAKLPTAARPEG